MTLSLHGFLFSLAPPLLLFHGPMMDFLEPCAYLLQASAQIPHSQHYDAPLRPFSDPPQATLHTRRRPPPLRLAACAFFESCPTRSHQRKAFVRRMGEWMTIRPGKLGHDEGWHDDERPRWLRMPGGLERLSSSERARPRPPVFGATMFCSVRGASTSCRGGPICAVGCRIGDEPVFAKSCWLVSKQFTNVVRVYLDNIPELFRNPQGPVLFQQHSPLQHLRAPQPARRREISVGKTPRGQETEAKGEVI
ncbi:hypothetical protein F5888DRAFT_1733948, partial [Russula emetica]